MKRLKRTILCYKLFWMMLFLMMIPGISPAATLELIIPDGNPGQRVIGKLGFESMVDVVSFKLVIEIAPNSILSTHVSQFKRSSDFFPARCLGGRELNFAGSDASGKPIIIGFNPILTNGEAEIGSILLDIAADSDVGSSQTITLSGQVYTKTGAIIDLSPTEQSLTVIPFTDSDNDQMDDYWENWYFKNLSRTGTEDYDYDEIDNLQEYLDGTDPTDNILKGDANRDGKTDLSDVVTILQANSGIDVEICPESDTNRDDLIDILDALYILQTISEIR